MKVIINSGVSGSGKSHWTRLQEAARVVSTDNYLNDESTEAAIGRAHAKCFLAYIYALNHRVDLIIVDNTNTTSWEIQPYYLAAQSYGATDITVVRHTGDFETFYKRNTHKVPFEKFCIQVANFIKRDVLPWWKVIDVADWRG